MSDGPRNVGDFFDGLSDGYSEVIERCFPRYREMQWALIDYLPPRQPASVLELGCGTGNLSVLLAKAFPEAQLHLVDVSEESLEVCRQRLGSGERFCFEAADFRELSCDDQFDLVISCIAIHHIEADEKRRLFSKIHQWLVPEGVFSYADQFRGAAPAVYQRHIDNWRAETFQAGTSDEEWSMWMEHQQQHDHHDTLADQIDWLREAGFADVDCVWRYLLWTAVQARKP